MSLHYKMLRDLAPFSLSERVASGASHRACLLKCSRNITATGINDLSRKEPYIRSMASLSRSVEIVFSAMVTGAHALSAFGSRSR